MLTMQLLFEVLLSPASQMQETTRTSLTGHQTFYSSVIAQIKRSYFPLAWRMSLSW